MEERNQSDVWQSGSHDDDGDSSILIRSSPNRELCPRYISFNVTSIYLVDKQTNGYIMGTILHEPPGTANREAILSAVVSQNSHTLRGRSGTSNIKQQEQAHDTREYAPRTWSAGSPVYTINRLVIASLASVALSVHTSGAKLRNPISRTLDAARKTPRATGYEAPVDQRNTGQQVQCAR